MDDKQKGASCGSRGIKGMLVGGEWWVGHKWSRVLNVCLAAAAAMQAATAAVSATCCHDNDCRRLAPSGKHTHTQSQPNADRHNTMHIKCLNDNSNISECTEKIGVGYLVKLMHKSAIQIKIESAAIISTRTRLSFKKGPPWIITFLQFSALCTAAVASTMVGAEMREKREKWRSPPQDSYNKCHV